MIGHESVAGRKATDWATLGAIVSGGSAIDLPRLEITEESGARSFLTGYGLDPEQEGDRAELAKILRLARTFIEEVLLPWHALTEIPSQLPDRPVDLLLSASRITDPMRAWSCSMLRVCHAVAHALFLPGRDKVTNALAQVESRFREHLNEEDGRPYLGDLPLHSIRFKSGKPWNSLLMKLLCKKDNVAEEIYDHLGVRIITRSKVEALEVVRYLRDHHLVPFPNVKPSRSTNSLLDLEGLQARHVQLWQELEDGRIDPATYLARLEEFASQPFLPVDRRRNPFSDPDRRALQFTARVLIRHETQGSVERFFFPFEVQILDKTSWEAGLRGRASHEEYRARQREDARRRVFPWADPSGAEDVAGDGATPKDQVVLMEHRILPGSDPRHRLFQQNPPA